MTSWGDTEDVLQRECCDRKVSGDAQLELCVGHYDELHKTASCLDRQKYRNFERRRFKGWLDDAHFSGGDQGLFGWQLHNLTTLSASLAATRPGVAVHHVAMIGDSHTRKRYLALTTLLGKPVNEEDIVGRASFEFQVHQTEFVLSGGQGTGSPNGTRLIVSYAFWFRFVPRDSIERFESKLEHLEELAHGSPITTVFVNSGHWYLTRFPNAISFCHGLKQFVESSLEPLAARLAARTGNGHQADVFWMSNSPINYALLDEERRLAWNPGMEYGFYSCSRDIISQPLARAQPHHHARTPNASVNNHIFGDPPLATNARPALFVDLFQPGLHMPERTESDGYHADPKQSEFQAQAMLNYLCGAGAAGRSGFAGYLKTKEANIRVSEAGGD